MESTLNASEIAKEEKPVIIKQSSNKPLLWQKRGKKIWRIYIADYSYEPIAPIYFGDCNYFPIQSSSWLRVLETENSSGTTKKELIYLVEKENKPRRKISETYPIFPGDERLLEVEFPIRASYGKSIEGKIEAYHFGTLVFNGFVFALWRDQVGRPLGWTGKKNTKVKNKEKLKKEELIFKEELASGTWNSLAYRNIKEYEEIFRDYMVSEFHL